MDRTACCISPRNSRNYGSPEAPRQVHSPNSNWLYRSDSAFDRLTLPKNCTNRVKSRGLLEAPRRPGSFPPRMSPLPVLF
jgi:hypothetical protein